MKQENWQKYIAEAIWPEVQGRRQQQFLFEQERVNQYALSRGLDYEAAERQLAESGQIFQGLETAIKSVHLVQQGVVEAGYSRFLDMLPDYTNLAKLAIEEFDRKNVLKITFPNFDAQGPALGWFGGWDKEHNLQKVHQQFRAQHPDFSIGAHVYTEYNSSQSFFCFTFCYSLPPPVER